MSLHWRPLRPGHLVISVGLLRSAKHQRYAGIGTVKLPDADAATFVAWTQAAVPCEVIALTRDGGDASTPTPTLPAQRPTAPTWRISLHEKHYGLLESRWFRQMPNHWDRFATITSSDDVLLQWIVRLSRVAEGAGGGLLLDTTKAVSVVADWRNARSGAAA